MKRFLKDAILSLLCNRYSYRLAKFIVRKYDNDANSDIMGNGEFFLLKFLVDNRLLTTLFDVGANVGNYTKLVLELNSKVRIFAFEPDLDSVVKLKLITQGYKNVVVVPKALSSETGSVAFYKNTDPQYSELNSVYDMSSIGYTSNAVHTMVECTTLDQFCSENGIDHIDFLKIDVEGHELAVLRGASDLLSNKQIDFIQVEFGHASRAARTFLFDLVFYLGQHKYRLFIVKKNCLESLNYSPWEENRFNLINLVAIPPTMISTCRQILRYSLHANDDDPFGGQGCAV